MRPQMWSKSNVLSIGITTLLILGLLLCGCAPEEPAPALSAAGPSTGEEEVVEAPSTEEAELTTPATVTEEPATTATPTPPRPETPFVTKEEGILFQEDFEDGVADGCVLEHGWQLTSEGSNSFLSGSGHSFAYTPERGWTDYTVEARIRLIAGTFHLWFRNAMGALEMSTTTGYFLDIDEKAFLLRKNIESDFFDLGKPVPEFGLNTWRSVKITVEGSNIKVYLDGILEVNYVDSSAPILAGEFALESLDDCQVQIDDITVTGVKLKQRTKWVKTSGPPGGVGYDVRISPVDKNIMFVTDNPSGVNKSYDGGQNWVQRNRGITTRIGGSLDGIPIFCLTIDPNNPEVVWVGTQGARGVSKSRGIYQSVDGGETWAKQDNGVQEMDEITFRSFAVHPQNSDVVLTGTEITTGFRGILFDRTKGKIYKTEDGGENWRCVWEGDSLVRVTIFDYTNPDIVYASTGIMDREPFSGTGEGILKSTDGGETWHQINNGLTTLNLGFLEMHPRNPEILFAAGGANALTLQGGDRGIYRTKDGGQHWSKVLTDDNTLSFSVVVISPSNPDVVYAGSEAAFYRSDDGGDNWHRFNKPEENCYGPPGIRAGSPIGAVVDPDDPMTVFVNNYGGGVLKSTDGGRTWVDWSKGYTGTQLFDIVVDSGNPAVVYTIGRNGPFRSFNSGEGWTGLNFVPIDHTLWLAVALNPAKPQEVLVSDQDFGVIHKSTDGGHSWRNVYHNPLFDYRDPGTFHGFSTIAYAPSNPSIVYAGMRKSGAGLAAGEVGEGSSFGIFKSTDSGETWLDKNRGLEHSMRNINDIVVHPTNPNIVYAATHNDGIFRSVDGGESWVAINNGLMALQVYSLAINHNNPDTIYAGLGQGVGLFKSVDGGQHWEGINYGIRVECPSYLQRVGQVKPGVSLEKPKRLLKSGYYSVPWTNIRSIVIDPVETQTLYAGDLQGGVYISTDGGESWTAINDGLSTKAVAALAISADGRVLYAATVGEGVFRLELWQGETSIVIPKPTLGYDGPWPPIIDAHVHLGGRSPQEQIAYLDELVTEMDKFGVVKATLEGQKPGIRTTKDDEDTLASYNRYPQRFYPYLSGFNPQDQSAVDYVKTQLKMGVWKGLGEIYLRHSTPHGGIVTPVTPADHPVMLQIYDLCAEYKVPIHIHFEPDYEIDYKLGMDEFKRALAHNPNAIFIWAHALPEKFGLMDEFPNLYLEGYYWRELVLKNKALTDRLVIGTDVSEPGPMIAGRGHYADADGIIELRELVSSLDQVMAENIAYKNMAKLMKDESLIQRLSSTRP